MTAELLQARVAGQFEALDWVITNIDTERFGRRPQVDKWSAHEHLAHVACSQQRFLERLTAILTTDQTIWLALALETLFCVSGTIVGTAPILRAVQL